MTQEYNSSFSCQNQNDDYYDKIIKQEMIKLENNNKEILVELESQREDINSINPKIVEIDQINSKNNKCLNYFNTNLVSHYFFSLLNLINPYNYINNYESCSSCSSSLNCQNTETIDCRHIDNSIIITEQPQNKDKGKGVNTNTKDTIKNSELLDIAKNLKETSQNIGSELDNHNIILSRNINLIENTNQNIKKNQIILKKLL